jgi:hypothetical protein
MIVTEEITTVVALPVFSKLVSAEMGLFNHCSLSNVNPLSITQLFRTSVKTVASSPLPVVTVNLMQEKSVMMEPETLIL